MPNILKTMVLPQVLRQEAILDIALTGSFDELVALMTTDPLCSRLPMGKVREMVRDMVTAEKQWIQNPRLLEFT
jgi:alpha-galactosidase/6-phospho-beta-glucosidase family protein